MEDDKIENLQANRKFLNYAKSKVTKIVDNDPCNAAALTLLADIGEAAYRNEKQLETAIQNGIKDMAAGMDEKCKAAGLPDRVMPYDATEYKHGGHTTTFRIDGRRVTWGEFRAELRKRGVKPESLEKRLAATENAERFTTRSEVTVCAGNESLQ
jgi:hypothetical protein